MTSTTLGHKNCLDKWGAVQILLIDEVLAVGDIEFQKKCIDKMMGFKNGVTMVFVSHPMSDVERICDRVMWIEDHCIKMIGEPEEVVKSYSMS
jgi:lipopolysaccharide transport system ATP-binding protein